MGTIVNLRAQGLAMDREFEPGEARHDEAAFRHALGHFASGVTVITTLDGGGGLCGLTASSFTSLSLEPPLVLACLGYKARTQASVMRAGAFTVHILHAGQEAVARGFARSGGKREEVAPWRLSEAGLPLLEEFHSALECSLERAYPGGDHAILVGRVLRLHQATGQEGPLLYYKGQMRSFDR